MKTHTKRGSALWAVVLAGVLWGELGAVSVPAYAQKSTAVVSIARTPDQDISIVDAQRGALDRFLDAHPEIESDVLGNPSAMSDPNYLKEHSQLQAFLETHPQIKADPRAFLSPAAWRCRFGRSSDAEEFLSYFVPTSIFLCCLLAFLWLFRTVLENRRWNRSFKVHEDVHSKLIEKFASGQDFSAYMQSDAGRRLLEWTPPVMDTSRGLPNPLGRILWSLQAGLVLLLVGLGLLLLRGQMSASAAPPLLVFGTLGVTLGAGFTLSAVVSYGLSKHLGLIGGAGQGSEEMVKR